MKYIRLPNAAIPVDDGAFLPQARRVPAPPLKTYWARRPYQSHSGTCVAVRVQGELMWVAIRKDASIIWKRADEALFLWEARAWFNQTRFTR
jgi:hypothetical protein